MPDCSKCNKKDTAKMYISLDGKQFKVDICAAFKNQEYCPFAEPLQTFEMAIDPEFIPDPGVDYIDIIHPSGEIKNRVYGVVSKT